MRKKVGIGLAAVGTAAAATGAYLLYWLLRSSVQKQALQDRERAPSLLANTGGLVYNQQSSTACSCSNDDTLT
jgi:hypothetical protein